MGVVPFNVISRSLLVGLAVGVLAGCDTMKQDFQAFGDSLTPVSPQQAARWMVDPHDPDNRRKGVVLISNSTFGGADPYVAVYRDYTSYETNALVKAAAVTALGRHGLANETVDLTRRAVRLARAAAIAWSTVTPAWMSAPPVLRGCAQVKNEAVARAWSPGPSPCDLPPSISSPPNTVTRPPSPPSGWT